VLFGPPLGRKLCRTELPVRAICSRCSRYRRSHSAAKAGEGFPRGSGQPVGGLCWTAPQQDRLEEEGGRQAAQTGRFINEPDTDPALEDNRQWALEALATNPGEHGVSEIT